MARFLVQGGQQGAREISLKPGVNRLGRREENDHQINDPTVSSFHCEIHVDDGSVRVKDLGSTNGTFLNAAPIQEATLAQGQILKLGGVEMVFHDDRPAMAPTDSIPAAPPLPPAIRIAGATRLSAIPVASPPATQVGETVILPNRGGDDCNNHPGTRAAFVCQRCGNKCCTACVKTQRAAHRTVYSCPSCGGLCVDADTHRKALVKQQQTFFSMLPDAFRYPLRQNGPMLLICGTIVFTLVELARLILQKAGYMGYAYWITVIMSVGYLFAFMQSIIVSSTNGEENMPGFPEVSNFSDDIFMPFIRFVMIWVVCLGPGIAAMILLPLMLGMSPALGFPVLLFGLFCFPMSLLTVSLADSIAGLNPLVIFSGISKVPGPYMVTCLILLGITGAGHAFQMGLELFGIPLLPMVLSMPVSLYGLTVGMRILGLLYYTNKEKLSWYN